MKTSTCILLALIVCLTACARSGAAPRESAGSGPVGEVTCELVQVESVPEADSTASFRVDNSTRTAISYVGFGKDAPMYSVEVLEGGSWTPHQMGWCGTGSSTFSLEPGDSQIVKMILPADGRSYRYRFGEPPVVTPSVSANAK